MRLLLLHLGQTRHSQKTGIVLGSRGRRKTEGMSMLGGDKGVSRWWGRGGEGSEVEDYMPHPHPPARQVALCAHPWVWPWAKTGIQRGVSISSHRAERTGGGFRFPWSSQKDLVPNKRLWVLSQEGGSCPEKASAQYIPRFTNPSQKCFNSSTVSQQYCPLPFLLDTFLQRTELRETCRDIKTGDNKDCQVWGGS